jgi:hypothetical protein
MCNSLCFKRPCNSRMLLSFVIVGKILLELVGGCHIFLFNTFLKKLWIFFLMLWVFMFWTSLITIRYCLMHCNLALSYHMCLNFREKISNPHSPKLIQLTMILKLFLNCFYLLLISIGKFVMFWNLSFLFKEDIKKENLTTYYVWS